MKFAYWSRNEISRSPRSFDSDLIKFSGKDWASRTASLRGQEIFPIMSGDTHRHTKEVSSKKSANFFWDFNFGSTFRRLLHWWTWNLSQLKWFFIKWRKHTSWSHNLITSNDHHLLIIFNQVTCLGYSHFDLWENVFNCVIRFPTNNFNESSTILFRRRTIT